MSISNRQINFDVGYIMIHIHASDIDDFIKAVRKRNGWKIKFTEWDMWFCTTTHRKVAQNLDLSDVISRLRDLIHANFYPKDGEEIWFTASTNVRSSVLSNNCFFQDGITTIDEVYRLLEKILDQMIEPDRPKRLKNPARLTSQQKKDRSRLGWLISSKLN